MIMTKRTLILLLAAVLLFGSACLCSPLNWIPFQTQPPTKVPPQVSSPTPIPPEWEQATPGAADLSACLERLPGVLVDAENEDFPGQELPMEYTLAEYAVSGDELLSPEFPPVPARYGMEAYQNDPTRLEQIWQFVADVIPSGERTMISRFILYTDGVSGSLGAIEQTDDPHLWSLQLDVLDSAYYPLLSTTLIHELAHLITVQEAQLTVNGETDGGKPQGQSAPACENYQMFEGCSTDSAYLTRLYDRFWPDIYAEWEEIDAIPDESERETALDDFYRQHVDEFVSWYAPTNPEEDLAESFMYFVFSGRPSGDTLLEEKILFFHDFPALVTLRDQLQDGLCAYLPPE
jgi:hypothetical protein